MSIGDIARKLTVEYETRGADEAIRKGKDFAGAQREIASASVATERAVGGAEGAIQKMVAQVERSLISLKQSEQAQRAYAAAQQASTAAVGYGARTAGLLVSDVASVVGPLTRQVAPALGLVAKEGVTAAAVMAREVAPALTIVAKEAAIAAAAAGKELAPAIGAVVKEFAPILAPAAIVLGGYFLAAAAIAFVAKNAHAAVDAYKEFEDSQITLQNLLTATAGAAGKTADDINKLVLSIGDVAHARTATQELLKFRSIISGDTFDRALKVAKDLSASGFGGLADSAKLLASALKDLSEDGLKRLEDGGLRFSAAQKQMIGDLRDTGKEADAQRVILDAVASQVGGAGAAKENSLSGAYVHLSDALKISSEQFGESIVQVTHLVGVINALAGAITALNNINWQPKWSPIIRSQQQGQNLANSIQQQFGVTIPGAITPADREQADAASNIVSMRAGNRLREQQKDRIDGVSNALKEEIRTLKLGSIEQKIDEQLRKARVDGASQEGKEIADLTREREKLKDNGKDTVNGYDQLIQRAKDHNDELKLEAELTGRATTEVLKLKLQHDAERAAKKAGVSIDQEKLDAIKEELALQTKAVELARVNADIKFTRQTVLLSPEEAAIAQKLRKAFDDDIPAALASAEAAAMRMNAAIKTIHDSGQAFVTSFVHGLMQGKSAVDSLIMSFDQLATKMADKAITDLFSGNFLRGAVEAAVAAAAALSSAFLKSSEAQKKAAENLARANASAQQLSSQIGGAGSGSVVQHMTEVNLQAMQVLQSFHGAVTQASIQLNSDLQRFFHRTVDDFLAGWEGALNQLGDNSEFAQARGSVAALGQTILDFVNNTRDLGTSTQVLRAQSAGRDTLLAMIAAPQSLSDVGTELARINGTAVGLQSSLVTLGDTAQQAADQISSGVTAALGSLAGTFTSGLTARLNTAGGRSFLNDFTGLFAKHAQDLADAAALGLGGDLANSVFAAEAQKIVNDSNLVGDAFTNLTNQFPSLIGVVHEATGAIEDQAAAQDRLNSGANTVLDFITNLVSGPGSTLSPRATLANAQTIYNANLGQAQAGNLDAVSKFPQTAENLLKAAQTMFGSSAQYQAIRAQIIAQGLGLPAVQTATDPLVIAMRDAITAIEATTTAVVGTTAAVGTVNTTTGIVANNTGSTASSLGSIAQNTNATATNTGSIGNISAQTGTLIANTGNAAVLLGASNSVQTQYLPAIYTGTIATSNASGAIQSLQTQFLPPIYQNTGATATNTGSIGNISINTGTAANLLNSTNNSGIGAVVINTGNAAQYIGSNDNEGTRGILTLLSHQLNSSPISVSTNTGTGVQNFTLNNNNVIDALNKIVFNTFAIALNTFTLAQFMNTGSSGGSRLTGTYADGGTIPSGGLGLVSEHLNPTFLRAGAEPIHVFPGSAANDNSGIVQQLEALRRESADQNFKIAQLINMLCNLTGRSRDDIVEAVEDQTSTIKAEARQDRNNPQRKAA